MAVYLHVAETVIFLFLLVFVRLCYGTADIVSETCTDRYGADLSKNFAFQKPAQQSSTTNGGDASRLVDGNRNPYFVNGSCSETDVGTDLTWSVDLQTEIYVTSVTITTRADDYWLYAGFFEILAAKDSNTWNCANGFLPSNGKTSLACSSPKKTQSITIKLPGSNRRLSLCEVEVYGRPLDFHDNEVNYALGQHAQQVSTHGKYVASRAVDGDRDTDMSHDSCAHTEPESFPWWRVDLGITIDVYATTITNRVVASYRASDFEILVGPSENVMADENVNCAGRHGLLAGETKTIFCFHAIRGRYVAIVSRLTDYFNFCEVSVQAKNVQEQNEECLAPQPLGMESYRIDNSQIQVSSEHSDFFAGKNSRLNRAKDSAGAGAWCALLSPTSWLQVDFLLLTKVTKIRTQGRHSYNKWVKSYTVSYGDSDDGLKFVSYKQNGQNKVFAGNNDRHTIVQHSLSPIIVARFIRIYPQTWQAQACMRAEFVGCYKECASPQPLGMENGNILDSQLSASSVANTNCNAEHGRINFYAGGHKGSWCSNFGASGGTEWLQVDFLKLAKVTEIQTQGRQIVDQWVLTYTVSYGDDGVNFQVYYQNGQAKVFSGNKDRTSIVRQGLSPAILARFLRIIPQTYKGSTMTMRAEFVGCYKAYQYKECAQPLGMANYGIAGSQISASTQVDNSFRAENARLYFTRGGGRNAAWAAAGANLWLQVDFLRTVTVTGIQTQGRQDASQWVTTYTVSFGDDGVDFYFHPQNGPAKIFPGNTDRNSIVSNDVSPYIVARFVRIHPQTWDGYVCMRAEFIGLHKECSAGRRQPLGMENFEILDSQISASSEHSSALSARFGRLNIEVGHGSWAARFNDINQWLQVDFLGIVTVTGIQTQGRRKYSQQWVSTYKVSFGFDGIDFHFYQENRDIKVFSGNTDVNSIVQNDLLPGIVVRFIRIHPQTWKNHICMTAEFIGFPAAVKLIDPEYVSLENRLSASSFLDRRHSPHLGIISENFNSSSWTPAVNEIGQYIQVDLLQLTPILGVALQTAADQPNDYHTKVIMKYSDIEGSWKVKKDYVGKKMEFTTVDCCKQFENILLARHVRFHIVGWGRRIGFRFQLFGTKDYKDVGAGIEDGSIKDHQMISSNHPNDPFPAYEGRVNSLGAWCGNTQRKRLFLQVNFLSNFRVHGVATQGKPTGIVQYVTQYKLLSTMDDVKWTLYKELGQVKIFPGNVNGECSRKHIVQPFLVRSLRFLPTAWENKPCMRIEVFGVYKGILQVHVRSGNVIGRYGSVLHKRRSIKLNGQEVSEAGDGYNIAVVDYTTGDLISSNLVSADFSIFNDLLTNIGNDSIVVVAAQNVPERLPDETLYLLESLGAIRLRYSMIYEHHTWILVGFKGSEKVDWITEKHGKTGEEAIRVAASITLNERKIRPVYQQYFKDTSYGSGSDLAIAGQHAVLLQNVTSRCGTNNDDDCQDGLSLAMWMKHDLPRYKKTTTVSMDERYVYEHYSQGFNYIVPIVSKTWHDARAYCLALEADLVAIHSQHTLNFIQDLLNRLGIGVIYIGLNRHPDTSIFHWTDGSNIVFSSWRSSEPNSLSEHCVEASGGVWNDLSCDPVLRFICQQPIEDRINLMPLGMESETIQDSSINASSIYDGFHLAHFARPNTQRSAARSWCPLTSDKEPYLHVDLGRTKGFCAIGTQGRGLLDASVFYPTSYSIKLSNDSLDWVFLKQNGQQKIFRANEDRTSMVINRFQQAAVAQYVRLYVKTWNDGLVCVRMEIYACKTEQEHQDKRNLISNVLPKSITGKTPENCLDLLMSGQSTDGVYMINPDGEGAFPTFCDQTNDGGGWTVFQRRMDGSVSFSRTMDEYKLGFGNLFGEYWLGLENIVKLTRKYRCELRVDLVSFTGETHHAVYSSVMVGDEDDFYRIYFDGGDFLGPGSNGLTPHGRATFTISNGRGWWYKGSDQSATLNGEYYSTYNANRPNGITWWPWKNAFATLKETKMMIRRRKVHEGALGIESSFIMDAFMKTNDNNLLAGYGAPAARLHNVKNWWTNEPAYYIMINLVRLRLVTHIGTQGGSDFNFVKNFYIQLLDQSGFWVDYKEHGVTKIFEGNNERTRVVSSEDIVSNCLKETLPATAIKIYPTACDASCSFRLELYSCETSCSAPLGVESDVLIASEKMTASSTKSGTTPGKGRLFQSIPWCADHTNHVKYLQIDFLELFSVSFVATQGGVFNGIKSFVTTYSLMYIDTGQKWVTYGGRKAKIFRGNTNSDTVVKNKIETPFLAYSIRFVGRTWENFVCLRVEVYGCYPDNPTFIVHTDSAIAGGELRVKGKYRYCQDSLCPGCKKSLCLRVFNEIHRIAAHFLYDCVYHDFEIDVQAPVIPGLYKIYMGDNDYSNCKIDPSKSNERLVGSVTVIEHYSNCLDLLLSGHTESGIYSIDPDGNGTFEVYCDQETFGGGWTVIQRRVDGNESFDRLWADYKNGFGQLDNNLWLGNDFIHRLTKIKREVLLEVESENDDKAFVLYKSFQVEGEDSFYKLHISDYQESVGDCIEANNGTKFTTRDRDNDKHTSKNCAATRKAGWWYKACTPCSLNGVYDTSGDLDKIQFENWAGNVVLDKVQMKLRDQHVVTCNDQYCYYLTKAKKSWFEAVEECRSFNAHLVSIRNAVDSQWIAEEILSEQVVDKVHLGLEMDAQWTDGSSFDFNNFPNGAATAGCAFLQKDGSWGREDCYTMKRVLCKKGKFCLKGKCFVRSETQMTYNSTRAYCRDIGYNMAKISSATENEYIRGLIRVSSLDSSWRSVFIGLHLDSSEFIWNDGTSVVYSDWLAGKPLFVAGKSCVRITRDGWKDIPCDNTHFPLCEKVFDKMPVDCLELMLSGSTRNGIYSIDPDANGPIQVYCDQETFGGGWTLLIRRVDGSDSFLLDWESYKKGFGFLDGNFWLGNDFIHRLTQVNQEVLFDLESTTGDSGYALYESFKVEDESNKYKLTIEEYQNSDVGDGMVTSNGMYFTTKDRDNDLHPPNNCAVLKNGGWWHNACSPGILTATYDFSSNSKASRWSAWGLNKYILKSQMKVRGKNVVTCGDQFCYYLTNVKKSWTEAVQECRKFNADLVSIHDEVENQWIVDNILTPRSLAEVYLGLGMENVNEWTDRSTSVFTKLQTSVDASTCATLQQSGAWAVGSCDRTMSVLCKRGKFCFQGDCYVLGATARSWDDSRSYCQKIGYDLVKISSKEESEYIQKLFRASTSDSSLPSVFIGLRLIDSNWQWVDGTMLRYSRWTSGRPNGSGPCVVFPSSGTGWIDGAGTSQRIQLCEKGPIFKSCDEVMKYGHRESGFYIVNPEGVKSFKVFCDFTIEGGPWTVIQRRVVGNALDYHTKTWQQYRNGFSDNEASFWLGNKYIHELTKTPRRLKITMHTSFNVFEAVYEDFTVKNEDSKFAIDFGSYSGTAGDSLSRHRGMKFSTVDQDNDLKVTGSCTGNHPGGWWFANCLDSNLNGKFTTETNTDGTLFWRTITVPILKTEIKIQTYEKVVDFQSHGIIRRENSSLGVKFDANSMEIKMQTSSEQWSTRVLHPGPFLTHVAITWDENSYLRYYENGTLLTKVPSLAGSDRKHSNSSGSLIANPHTVWANRLVLWDTALTEYDVERRYTTKNFTFEDDSYIWLFQNTSRYNWDVSKTCTLTDQTGPCGDHTYLRNIGTFVYTEASLPALYNDKAIIESPSLLPIYRCLSFWYHLFGSKDIGTLTVYLTKNISVPENITVWSINATQGNYWRFAEVHLNDVSNIFKIVIEATRGDGFFGDIAVDDVSLTMEKCENECKPSCGAGEFCDRSSLRCIFKGYYDYRWALDSSEIITDERNSSQGSTLGNVVLTSGVIDEALELQDDGKIQFGEFRDECSGDWCFPIYTISTWLKYEGKPNHQQLLAFGDIFKIFHDPNMPKEDQLTVEVTFAKWKCTTSFFVPPEVWSHIIVSVAGHKMVSIYLDGHSVVSPSNLNCLAHATSEPDTEALFYAGGLGGVSFAIDDVRLLFDALAVSETTRSYELITGEEQTIFIRAKLTSEVWNNDLLQDTSSAHKSLSKLVIAKIMATLEDRSGIKNVVVIGFTQGSVVADINLVYTDVHYQDILLVEEALYVNNTFDGLGVNGVEMNSSSVPSYGPSISVSAINSSTLWVNWTHASSFDLNGIFQGYKFFYRETEKSSYTQYHETILYGNNTGILLTELRFFVNYTMRVLTFTLSGDGLLSESITVVTPDGEVTVSPSVSAVNVSSTVIYTKWTTLPNASVTYGKLLGYHGFYWKDSDLNSVLKFTTVDDHFLCENLEKWTVYCFNVSGYTSGGVGPARTQCTRTFEDAPEEPPSNVTVVDTTKSSVEIQWSPPPASSVPGIIRYYNISYRVLNYSDPERISLTVSDSPTLYKLENLNHTYVLLEINISAFTVATGPVYTMYALTEEGEPVVAPGNISLLNVSSTAVDVNWTGLARPLDHGGVLLGYRIFIWKQSEGNESSYNTTVSTAFLHVHLDGLERWTVYCSQVAAFTIIGDGPRSSVLCTRTFEDAPEEPPSNLTIVSTTWSTIKVQWSPPPSYSVPGILRQYNLTYRNLNYSDERLLTLQFDSTVTSHTLENLIGLTMYEINITSFTILPGPWGSLLVITDEGVPGSPPLNVSLYNISSTSLRMNWSAIPPSLRNGIVLGYRISIWKQSEGNEFSWNITIPSVLVKQIDGLEKWTTYCMQILAFTSIDDGPLSPVKCIRTFEDAPEMPPTNLNVSNITWSTLHLSWDAIDSSFIPGILRSYRVTYRIIDPGFDQSNHSFLVDSRFTSTNITGLQGLTNYQVMVRGVTVNDGPLESIQLQTEEGVPTMPPVAFNTSDTTSTTFLLGWQEILATEKHGIIRGYELTYEKEGTINQTKTITLGSSALSAFLFQLLPFSLYKITLRGFTSKGNGVKGIIRKLTSEGIPSVAPKNAYGINFTGPTSIFLGWSPLTTEELQGTIRGYKVRYKAFSVADEELIDPQEEIVTVANGGLNGITLTGLSTYTTYIVSVAAMSGGGVGVRSRRLYVATCRCFKILNTNYWNYQPYANISGMNSDRGFFPYLLDMVTLSCCQTCLEHGTSEIDYFKDGQGNPSEKSTDLEVKMSVSMETDFSFPVFGYKGQTAYSRYYGFAAIVETVGTVFFTLKPDYSSIQGEALIASIFSIVPFLAIAVIFAVIAGIIIWALESGSNEEEFPPSFTRGAPSGFWWAFITMTTVGYGDKTARTLGGRIFALIWILVGLVICSLLIGTIASAFTSVAMPEVSETLVYGSQVGALQDSPDHKLGVRRNAKMNTYKKYHTLEEVQQSLLTEQVQGILIDAYVADSRKDLFTHSRLMIKKVIDLTSSYGVIMGRDSKKLQKCFRKFWKANAAAKSQFIKDHSTPVKITDIGADEMMEDTYNPQGAQYQISLNSCLILLGILFSCGLIYEIRRRKKISSKVEPEKAAVSNEDLKNEEAAVPSEDLKNEVSETPIDYPSLKQALLLKFTNEFLTLAKLKRRNKLEEA